MDKFLQSKGLKIVLLILVFALLGLIIFYSIFNYKEGGIGVSGRGKEQDAETSKAALLDEASLDKEKGEQIIYISKDEIYKFSMTDSNGIVLGFEYIDDKWVYTDDPDMNINQERIDKILNYLSDIRSVEIIENADGSKYGLSQDSKTFTLGEDNDNYIIISVGNIDEATGKVYFAVNYDFTTVYVNGGKLGKLCEYGVQDLL
ncbi:hypothetical protein CIY_19890 [Butyrivibrio fibrisolvens 16/4]|nr:hypothetical protein CIY_19890 [Butyrivibrio fibrisolvens 16/4]